LLLFRYDYNDLLANSTFCLSPRGRRLATYRFLEALKVGCIPVILSNGWILPFSEILNWKKAVLFADERFISEVNSFKLIQIKNFIAYYFI
jgi:glucuronyl/N-acetylglucosaminyl transferase EXT1